MKRTKAVYRTNRTCPSMRNGNLEKDYESSQRPFQKTPYNAYMLSKESKIEIISEIIHEHLKGKHKDKLSRELASLIIEELDEYDK